MNVLKFGGTSIGTEGQIKKVVDYLSKQSNNGIAVFSAFSDITNYLSEFIKQVREGEFVISEELIVLIEEKHNKMIHKLFQSENYKQLALKKLNASLLFLKSHLQKKISEQQEKEIMVQGELLSGMIIYLYMLESGIDVGYLDALKFLKLDILGEPDYNFIQKKLSKEMKRQLGCRFYITNGFICLDARKLISNLGRGGSDYTATIIAKTLQAEKVEIWTDIDGLQNNDPRYVNETYPIRHLSYNEASELAYFGAKILHPTSIVPAQQANIPIVIRNSFNLKAEGTLINNYTFKRKLSAIAAKDGVTIIKIKSGRMMQAYGFLRKLFEIFEKYETPVDMLTTSEISVAMTIDNCKYLTEIVDQLKKLGSVEVVHNQSIVCIVGNFESQKNIVAGQIIEGLGQIPIQMISFGASKINFSLVVNTEHKQEALQLLNHKLFRTEKCLATN
ncbi:MAG: aspartate kinase [Thiohalospira sp.]